MVDGLLAKKRRHYYQRFFRDTSKVAALSFLPSVPSGMLDGRPSFLPVPWRTALHCRCFPLQPALPFRRGMHFKLAFPGNDDGPSFRLQLAPNLLVPFPIPGYLRCPEVGVGLRHRVELAPFVAVPETAVNEDGRAILGKADIRFPWEFLVIYSIAESLVPKGMTQHQLRLCGGGVDGSHVAMALGWSMHVGHRKQSVEVLLLSANLSLYLHKSPINCNER